MDRATVPVGSHAIADAICCFGAFDVSVGEGRVVPPLPPKIVDVILPEELAGSLVVVPKLKPPVGAVPPPKVNPAIVVDFRVCCSFELMLW